MSKFKNAKIKQGFNRYNIIHGSINCRQNVNNVRKAINDS